MKRPAFPEIWFRILGNRVALHVLFWTFLFSTEVLLVSGTAALPVRALHTGLFFSFAIAATYIHFFLLGRYANRRRYVVYVGGLLLTVGVLGALLDWIFFALFKHKGYLSGAIFSLLFFVGFTTALHYARAGVRQRMQLQEITAKQLQTELALLKAQINPHFFFNTLNNLYAMALREEDPATAQGIAKLSHLMRYVIYESNSDRVELSKEVEQIRSFIELQRLRFSEEDNIRIDLKTEGDLETCTVAPMLLLPFVENAFKHGIRLSSPSYVTLQLTAGNGAMRFVVENSIHESVGTRTDPDSALGLRNVRRRLELLYPDNHSLSVSEGQGVYQVVLDLGLENPERS